MGKSTISNAFPLIRCLNSYRTLKMQQNKPKDPSFNSVSIDFSQFKKSKLPDSVSELIKFISDKEKIQ